MELTTDLIRRICKAYDAHVGQTRLAEALGVNDRSVRRWVAGTERPRAVMAPALGEALRARIAQLDVQRAELVALVALLEKIP
jgi:hypothetical protein